MKPETPVLFYTTTAECRPGDVLWVEADIDHPEFFICHPLDFDEINEKIIGRKLIPVDSYLIMQRINTTMEEYLVRIPGRERNIIRIKTEKLELRDGALIFYSLREKESEGRKISRIIAAGEWAEVVRVIEDNEEDDEKN
jgi:hypothetical protein